MNESLDPAVIADCTRRAFDGTMPFPRVVERLVEVEVERYHVDLARLAKTYYHHSGRSHLEPLPLEDPHPIGDAFDGDAVRSAIRDIQQGRTIYPQFLRQTMAAGVVSYAVYITGRKAIYFGRRGDFHVENFPARP